MTDTAADPDPTTQPTPEEEWGDDEWPCGEGMCQCGCGCPRCGRCMQDPENCECEEG